MMGLAVVNRIKLSRVFLPALSLNWLVPQLSAAQEQAPRFESAKCPFAQADSAAQFKLECGYLVVPENRARRNGRTLRLAVGILRAPTASDDPPLVWFGSTGSALRNSLGRMIDERVSPERILPVTARRDVIVFDLRGTGLSEPTLCADFGRGLPAVDANPSSPAVRERRRTEVQRCVSALLAQGIDRSSFNAAESAADLADLRRALGYPVWDVYGSSYGARIALEAMRQHPQGIRSVVLADASPSGPALAERPLWTARALERVFEACRADSSCHSAIPTPEEDFLALQQDLGRTSLNVAMDGAPTRETLLLDDEALVALLERALHFPQAVAIIPLSVQELRRGDRSRVLRELIGRSGGRETRVAWYLTSCFDQFGPAFKLRSDSIMAMVTPAFRFRTLEDCDLWQDRYADASEAAPVRSDIPTLILAGGLSIEPPAFGRRIAITLTNAFVYELPGRPHGDRPTGCAATIISEFLSDPTHAPDASCIARMPPLSFVSRWPNKDR